MRTPRVHRGVGYARGVRIAAALARAGRSAQWVVIGGVIGAFLTAVYRADFTATRERLAAVEEAQRRASIPATLRSW